MKLTRVGVTKQHRAARMYEHPELMDRAFNKAFPYAVLLTRKQRTQFLVAAQCLATGKPTIPVDAQVADALDKLAMNL